MFESSSASKIKYSKDKGLAPLLRFVENKINKYHFTKEDYLSWIIVLDQFSRNIYRNQIKSFAGDEKALKLSKIAIKKSFLKSNEDNYNSFFLMPFMHSEKLSDHQFSLPFFKKYTNKKYNRAFLFNSFSIALSPRFDL